MSAKKTNKVAGKPGHDPLLPKVELVVNGETYHLTYDFNSIVRAEQVTGVNLLSSVIGEINASSLRGLLWSALLKDRPDLTIEHAGALIQPPNIATIRQAIVTAWFGSVEDQPVGEGQETPEA